MNFVCFNIIARIVMNAIFERSQNERKTQFI